MEDGDNPFKKAGWVLLVIGIIDIGVMAYCIYNKVSYSSSLNVFSVVSGILLIKGGVKTARVVRWFSAFLVVAFIGLIFLASIATPVGLIMAQLKLNALPLLGSFSFGVALIAVFVWVHLQLSTPESLSLFTEAGYKTGRPRSAYIAGAAVLVLAVGLSAGILNGKSAQKAKALAKEQLGPEFQYHVSSMSTAGNSGHAVVLAYKNNEIHSVQVQW